jgi:8-oxo-dGTP pyrophosphatase MutT (NUDIX family)
VNSAQLIEQIESWRDPRDGGAMKSLDLILHLLRHSDRPFSRDQFAPGHITATALVLNERGDSVLLVHHLRLDRWLLPGGHVEPVDATIFDTARREAVEETSVQLDPGFAPYVAGFDVHGIPPNAREPYHLHHDILIGLSAVSESIAVSAESRAVIWCPLADVARYDIPSNILLRLESLNQRHQNVKP